MLDDARLPRLRRLAWLWSLENLLLAAAVYHRLAIYIGFNGMTRMRTIGIFGMSCVVAGFLLVVWKIVRNRDFVWLVRHHLWALALAVYLFALTPVDAIVHYYNVRRITAGDPAPSVQISVHPIDSQGMLAILPLADADDPIIRDGVRAMLAERQETALCPRPAAECRRLDRLPALRPRVAKRARRRKRQMVAIQRPSRSHRRPRAIPRVRLPVVLIPRKIQPEHLRQLFPILLPVLGRRIVVQAGDPVGV